MAHKYEIGIDLGFKDALKNVKEFSKNMTKEFVNASKEIDKEVAKATKSFQVQQLREIQQSKQKNAQAMMGFMKGLGGKSPTGRQLGTYESLHSDYVASQKAEVQQIKQMKEAGIIRTIDTSAGSAARQSFMKVASGVGVGAVATMASGSLAAGGGSAGGLIGGILGGSKGAGYGAAVGGILGGAADVFGGRYMQNVGTYQKFRSWGYARDFGSMRRSAENFGASPEETNALTAAILTSRGTMDRGLLTKAQKFGTAYGVDTNTMSGMFQSIKAAGGGNYDTKSAEIYAAAVAAKLEKSRIGEWMEKTSSTISDFASKSAGVNTGSIAALMAAFTGMGKQFTPAGAATAIKTLDESFRNPTNDIGSMIRLQAMQKTLKQAGVKDILGTMQLWQQAGMTSYAGLPGFENVKPGAFEKNLGQLAQGYGRGLPKAYQYLLANAAVPTGMGPLAGYNFMNTLAAGITPKVGPWALDSIMNQDYYAAINNPDFARMAAAAKYGAASQNIGSVTGGLGQASATGMMDWFGMGAKTKPTKYQGISNSATNYFSTMGYRMTQGLHDKSGIDMVSADNYIHALTGGTVTKVNPNAGGRAGSIIEVMGATGPIQYMHGYPGVSVGQQIEANQILGQQGSLGRSTGPHVHAQGAGVTELLRQMQFLDTLTRGRGGLNVKAITGKQTRNQ